LLSGIFDNSFDSSTSITVEAFSSLPTMKPASWKAFSFHKRHETKPIKHPSVILRCKRSRNLREDEENDSIRNNIGGRIVLRFFSSILLTGILTLSSIPTFDAVSNQQTVINRQQQLVGRPSMLSTKPASAWALSPEQLLVDDVWREVTRQFVDPTYHGLGEDGWRQKRQDALHQVAQLGPPSWIDDDDDKIDENNLKKDPNEPIYDVIRNMLAVLDDPYTRFLTPQQYSSLTTAFTTPTSSSTSSSTTAGIGVQLIGSPTTSTTKTKTPASSSLPAGGGVIVANTIANGAAAKAGILPGDIIRKIDGVDVTDATAEVVAAQCRGNTGSRVIVEIERPSTTSSTNQFITLTLTRSPISSYQSIQTSFVTTSNNQRFGVVRLASFTQDTVDQVSSALKEVLEGTQKVDGLVIDVRGNAGGYMPAGVDVAKLFLPPRARIITEVDRTGRSTIYINDGVGSETSLPLYVLVDPRTASASEIMTAALQDNGRATVLASVSTDHTFGKGRIQNVQALQSGAGVAVTKAKYLSPNGRDIQGVGIIPDKRSKTCELKDSALSCLEGIV
jgi:carboxyl-terminal processing protease